MKAGDTSLGGPLAGGFPDTTWSLLSGIRDPQARERRDGIEALARRYWKPVYRYLRAAWARSNEDAKDLSQAFFLWIVERDTLRNYQRERGSFRRFLKILLDGFVNDDRRASGRLKRGGAVRRVSLDTAGADLAGAVADRVDRDPAREFDRAWMLELVRLAVERVRERTAGGPRAKAFEIYESYDLSPAASRPTYEELAKRHSLRPGEIKTHLLSMRDEVRAEIRRELSALTTDERELSEEWNELFGE